MGARVNAQTKSTVVSKRPTTTQTIAIASQLTRPFDDAPKAPCATAPSFDCGRNEAAANRTRRTVRAPQKST